MNINYLQVYIVLFFLCFGKARAQLADSTFIKNTEYIEKNRYDTTKSADLKARLIWMEKNAKNNDELGYYLYSRYHFNNMSELSNNMGSIMIPNYITIANYFIESGNRKYQLLSFNVIANAFEAKFNASNKYISAKTLHYYNLTYRLDYDEDYRPDLIIDDLTDHQATKNEVKKALYYLTNSYLYQLKLGNKEVQMYRLQRIGLYNYYLDNKFDGLENSYKKSLAIADSLKHKFKTYILGDLAVYAHNTGNYRKSIHYSLQGLEHCKEFNDSSRPLIFLDQLFLCYKKLQKLDSAYFYKDKSIALVEQRFKMNESVKNETLSILNKELHLNILKEKDYQEAQKKQIWLFIALGLSILLLVYSYFRNKNLKLKNIEISTALLKGQTIERHRVAADLHDNLGTTLSSIQWSLQSIDRSKMGKTELEIHQNLRMMLEKAYNDVRFLSHNLLPEEFEKQGLVPSLNYFARKVNQNSNIKFELNIDENIGQLGKKVEFELYSICLELVNNIMKHSKASKASIMLKMADNELIMEVADNGQGLYENNSDGKGLKNVRARVESLGGTWQMRNVEGKGVNSVVRIKI